MHSVSGLRRSTTRVHCLIISMDQDDDDDNDDGSHSVAKLISNLERLSWVGILGARVTSVPNCAYMRMIFLFLQLGFIGAY